MYRQYTISEASQELKFWAGCEYGDYIAKHREREMGKRGKGIERERERSQNQRREKVATAKQRAGERKKKKKTRGGERERERVAWAMPMDATKGRRSFALNETIFYFFASQITKWTYLR